ncbi:hypothetical protein TWF718_006490 [Orbilia javanica]|uniref:Uncharacterized protein n=1 Tax=Orbilia javanica TaxID=47235 RepID=A0AAN8N521_9PEZI
MKSAGNEDLIVMAFVEDPKPAKVPPPKSTSTGSLPTAAVSTVSKGVEGAGAPETPTQPKADANTNPPVGTEASPGTSPPDAPKQTQPMAADKSDGADNTTPKIQSIRFTYDYNFRILNKDKSTGKAYSLLVSKEVLVISSPVLKKLINGPASQAPIKQGRGESVEAIGNLAAEGVLHLNHDQYALQSILCAIHFCPLATFYAVSFETLTEIAVISDIYQWTKALKPWMSIWLPKLEKRLLLRGYENWLYISKIFDTNCQVGDLLAMLGVECGLDGTKVTRHDRETQAMQVLDTKLWPEERKST